MASCLLCSAAQYFVEQWQYMLHSDAIIKYSYSVSPRRTKENVKWTEEKYSWKRMSFSSSTETQLQSLTLPLTSIPFLLESVVWWSGRIFFYYVVEFLFNSFKKIKMHKGAWSQPCLSQLKWWSYCYTYNLGEGYKKANMRKFKPVI